MLLFTKHFNMYSLIKTCPVNNCRFRFYPVYSKCISEAQCLNLVAWLSATLVLCFCKDTSESPICPGYCCPPRLFLLVWLCVSLLSLLSSSGLHSCYCSLFSLSIHCCICSRVGLRPETSLPGREGALTALGSLPCLRITSPVLSFMCAVFCLKCLHRVAPNQPRCHICSWWGGKGAYDLQLKEGA